MIKKIYSIYDTKAQMFQNPSMMLNDNMAIRGAATIVNDLTTEYGLHPEDYTLYSIGKFDTETGDIFDVETISICPLITLVDDDLKKRINQIQEGIEQ